MDSSACPGKQDVTEAVMCGRLTSKIVLNLSLSPCKENSFFPLFMSKNCWAFTLYSD